MTNTNKQYSVQYDEHNQTIVFSGIMRPKTRSEMLETTKTLLDVAEQVSGLLYLDFKKLSSINNTAFKELTAWLKWIVANKESLKVKIITTSVIAWGNRKFSLLANICSNFALEQYDKDFYPGQGAIENESFIPVLRTQTKIIWQEERKVLQRHGLREGMRVADICCGIGDFAVLVQKKFKPIELLAVDHSKPSLQYARHVASEFDVAEIDYVYGDASALMIEDNRFDFVTCRLSLQIFDKPELILKELYRVCRPGGRVYLTNETYSKCFGEPGQDEIGWTYKEASRLFGDLGMNLEFGIRMNRYLTDVGFSDIMIEPMILTNLNTDPERFSEVIQSWEDYVVNELARDAGEDAEFCARLRNGFQSHIRAVTHPKGFGGWPIWVGSGMKP